MTEITFLRLQAVKLRLGLSRSSIYAAVQRGELAPPVKIGRRASAWDSRDIQAFAEHKLRQAGRLPPVSEPTEGDTPL